MDATLTSESSATRQPVTPPSNTSARRCVTHVVIAVYLSWLGHGVFCHALQYRVTSHPGMYFTVWDMFCGWSGWSARTHLVAEGESGQMYALTPTPWEPYRPFSDLSREHYDPFGNHLGRIAANTLAHTRHEPIRQVYVVEETWSKKFNLPQPLWDQVHSEPRDPRHYFRVTAQYQSDGTLLTRGQSLHDSLKSAWLSASLRGQSRRQPLFMVGAE